MSEPLVLIERPDAAIAVVTMNRPQALNALSSALRNALAEAFEALAAEDAVQVIVLTGAGRAFTVGLDLKELGGEVEAQTTLRGDPATAMASCGKPIIGAINGFAITGGFELALLCDFLIASPAATFADTHARVGVVPGWGLSQRLPRLIGINRAKELSLTGNYLGAETAERWGLVNRVVPADTLLETCVGLARDICSTDRGTRTEIRRIMDLGWASTLDDGLETEAHANRGHANATRDQGFSRSAVQARGRDQSS